MKNRLTLLLTILLTSALWTFAQVAPDPQPKPQPKPQPVQPGQPAQPDQRVVAPAPVDVIELRLDNETKTAQYERAIQDYTAAVGARNPYTAKLKTEKGSYIGLSTSPIPTVLRDQLKLPNGSGLVVERVEGNSPAEAAGMRVSDIIQKLDDQVLINPHQFGVLVRNLKPDVEVKLTVIRETKPQTVAIKPVEKDLAPLDETAAYGTPTAWRDTQLANTTRFGGGGGTFTLTTTPKKEKGNNAIDVFNAIDRTEMVTDNGKTKITTTIGPKGDRWACVVDKATGNVIFNGAIDTEEQRQALPKDVQDQIKQLDQMKLNAPMAIKAVPMPGRNTNVFFDRVNAKTAVGARNNLPKPKSVSGSDDDYTWEFTTKTDETGNPELELLLLDKNGKILFQGPFSRTRNIKELPAPMVERLSTYPWKEIIDDLKTANGNAANNGKGAAPQAFPEAPGAAPAGGGNFTPPPRGLAK